MRRLAMIAVFGLAALAVAPYARAQPDDSRYTIMVPEKPSKPNPPEPWLAPKYKSPRSTTQHVVIPSSPRVARPKAAVPPPIYVPETGRTLPNLPTVSGSGPGGTETSQDRAARCAHQAGLYGQAAGNRNSYIGGCINQ